MINFASYPKLVEAAKNCPICHTFLPLIDEADTYSKQAEYMVHLVVTLQQQNAKLISMIEKASYMEPLIFKDGKITGSFTPINDDDEPITFDWVASNFPSMGAAYSARQLRDFAGLTWQNRFERFVLYDIPQTHLKTRGDVRRLLAALGKPTPLDRPPNPADRRHDWLDI